MGKSLFVRCIEYITAKVSIQSHTKKRRHIRNSNLLSLFHVTFFLSCFLSHGNGNTTWMTEISLFGVKLPFLNHTTENIGSRTAFANRCCSVSNSMALICRAFSIDTNCHMVPDMRLFHQFTFMLRWNETMPGILSLFFFSLVCHVCGICVWPPNGGEWFEKSPNGHQDKCNSSLKN